MSFFSENLQLLRFQKNWKQSDLAEKAQITQACISQLERGVRKPTQATINKLCLALEVTKEALIGTEGVSNEREALMIKIRYASPEVLSKISEYADFIIGRENP